jgi:hypothetical protein
MNYTPSDVYYWPRAVLEQRCVEFGLEPIGSVRELRERLSAAFKLKNTGTSVNMETVKASIPEVKDLVGEGLFCPSTGYQSTGWFS